mgnify:CR=1 FL=1
MKKLLLALTATSLMTMGSAQAGNAEAGKSAYSTCVGCHGAAGEGGVGPALAGRDTAEISDLLKKYRAGEQVGPMTSMMAPMAANLSDADIENIAAYVKTL